jgi:hypothetical protein
VKKLFFARKSIKLAKQLLTKVNPQSAVEWSLIIFLISLVAAAMLVAVKLPYGSDLLLMILQDVSIEN